MRIYNKVEELVHVYNKHTDHYWCVLRCRHIRGTVGAFPVSSVGSTSILLTRATFPHGSNISLLDLDNNHLDNVLNFLDFAASSCSRGPMITPEIQTLLFDDELGVRCSFCRL